MTDNMPNVLIEDWLPIDKVGAESLRDASAARKPPLNRLHVWWARRPLTVSRAAIIGSVLPQWSADWPPALQEKFPDEASYHAWFLRFLGILGDPVAGRKLIQKAKEKNIMLKGNPYGYPRALATNPAAEDLQTMGDLLEHTWGTRELSVLDPFAGGGSIPFESLRYGFTTIANDLNPVAATILKATLDYPARFGPELAEDIKKWGGVWAKRVEEKLADYFPKQGNESIFAYLWARTVACPTTGKPAPLSPNWWLSKGSDPVAVKLVAEPHMDAPQFVILKGDAAQKGKPDEGTISRGVGRSPWTGETISGDYIKAEAQAGRMGQLLYAIAIKKPGSGFAFRAPTEADLAAAQRAEAELARKKPGWIAQDLLPTEPFPGGNDKRPLYYGMPTWDLFFSPRQLLSTGIFIETLQQVSNEMKKELPDEKQAAVQTYLGIVLDKCVDYNCIFSTWEVTRQVVKHIFARHDFSMTWSYGEFDSAGNLLPWGISQIADAYIELGKLASPIQKSLITSDLSNPVDRLAVTRGSASSLTNQPDGSVHNITVDPPYYDNVQYAELADFFYVWLKRSVGHLFPEFFSDELTNKDDEAVANPARFESLGRKKKELAEQDYERKMAAAFREMHRVLHPHGVLTVMFTHKRVEAWDTLASALIGAGFTIKASWPVHTESEHSLHQAKKNAAASTILLVCRKRSHESTRIDTNQNQIREDSRQFVDEPVWWDDIQGRVRRVAREKALEYMQQGISGVDLYISTFGPTLSVISENWPVLTSEVDPQTGEPKPLRPETALDLAREEVVRLRKEGLLAGRSIEFDPVTDWYLMAWDAFQAEEFPYDEARKLAIALGLEMDYLIAQKKLVAKKSASVVLQQPKQRRKKGMVDPDAAHFEQLIDALHTAMLIYEEDGAGACDVFLQNRNLKRDSAFRAGLQTLINAIPRAKVKNKFVRPEADVLDRMRLAFYADELTVPPEEEPPMPQSEQLGFSFEEEDLDEMEEDE
ncbi:MAG: DUF1156 domain-containing protein [Anaerolineae bacterium]|nr:DUF1156 domain-containing protein [Anaerolineae bacterium]